jgi:hypothetical protein
VPTQRARSEHLDGGKIAREETQTRTSGPLAVQRTPDNVGSHLSPHLGSLEFEIRDVDTGATMPGKLTVLGTGGTLTPSWTRSDLPREESGFIMAYDRVFSLGGVGAVPLAPGTYDVYVSRGLEWDLFVARGVRIKKGGQAHVKAKLRHVVDTPGWLSADFHVHAAMLRH